MKTLHLLLGLLILNWVPQLSAQEKPLDFLNQAMTLKGDRLTVVSTIQVTGKPGDQFLLFNQPVVLTNFVNHPEDGNGLRLIDVNNKHCKNGKGLVITAPENQLDSGDGEAKSQVYHAIVSYHFPIGANATDFSLPTGRAIQQKVSITQKAEADQSNSGLQLEADRAIKTTREGAMSRFFLAPTIAGQAQVFRLTPKRPDPSTQKLKFFVQSSHLYIPGPGVIDGVHHLEIRPTQGEVKSLTLNIPKGFTVSEVTGEVSQWRFDPEAGVLVLPLAKHYSKAFQIVVKTQSSLSTLPLETTLTAPTIEAANGETGLLGLAFGSEAQLEKVTANKLSPINLGDFPNLFTPLAKAQGVTLQRAYRYGKEGGSLKVRIAPVAPEVRLSTRQVLSIGDEQTVFSVTATADISRAGIFQLSFPIPRGYEVESLSGKSLSHWSEIEVKGERIVVLHLLGKTLGKQEYNIQLTAPTLTVTAAPQTKEETKEKSEAPVTPEGIGKQLLVPNLRFLEATRQTGELVISPATGIRLRTLERKNISETDPRGLGAKTDGSLAYRLLQADWNLSLGIEKLDPWITAKILHQLTLREGQTKTSLTAHLFIEKASVRRLRFRLPGLTAEEAKTVRASGPAVSDLVPMTGADDGFWELRFKRRAYGKTLVQIEYERTGERNTATETLHEITSPDLRQVTYYMAIRAGARLELKPASLTRGWQRTDWSALPSILRDSMNRSLPALTFRLNSPPKSLSLSVKRHAVEDSLKLRVEDGKLTTVISPLGETLTAVDLSVEIVQLGTLRLTLPKTAELYNVFVNGQSTRIVREKEDYLFYIQPDPSSRSEGKKARVRFCYAMPGDSATDLKLIGPRMNLPLENIEWRVITPSQNHHLKNAEGDLEQIQMEVMSSFSKGGYLSRIKESKLDRNQAQMEKFQDVTRYQQSGDVQMAEQVLNNLYNANDLDAASNEDARVQLDELQKKKITLALQTRRQRVYLDNRLQDDGIKGNAQLELAASRNPLFAGNLKFKASEMGNLLEGNTQDENAMLNRFSTRIAAHQHSSEPAPRSLEIELPEESRVYTFKKSVQVQGDQALQLDLKFHEPMQSSGGPKKLLAYLLAAALVGVLCLAFHRRERVVLS